MGGLEKKILAVLRVCGLDDKGGGMGCGEVKKVNNKCEKEGRQDQRGKGKQARG